VQPAEQVSKGLQRHAEPALPHHTADAPECEVVNVARHTKERRETENITENEIEKRY